MLIQLYNFDFNYQGGMCYDQAQLLSIGVEFELNVNCING